MSIQTGDVVKLKKLPWYYVFQGMVPVTEDYVRCVSDYEFGLVVHKTDNSEEHIYDEQNTTIWLRAPAIPEPKQQRPAH